MNFQEKIKTT